MNEFKISGSALNHGLEKLKTESKDESGDFASTMKEAIGKVSDMQKEADKAIDDLTKGGDVGQAILAMEKADMSFQVMVETRNKLLSAYEEVMRMGV